MLHARQAFQRTEYLTSMITCERPLAEQPIGSPIIVRGSMSRWRRFVLTTVPGVVVAMGASPGLALGIGPYTLPFHDHTTTVVRGYTTDHRGIDYNLNYEPVVAARQGVVVDLREGYADSGTCTPVEGNYVLIRHPDGQHTLYLHLKQNSVIVSVQPSFCGPEDCDLGELRL